MSVFIVSDLHIRDADDPVYDSLLTLLKERAVSGDHVVLAGDIFDLFVGNKEIFRKRYRGFFEALSEAGNRGVQLNYIEGNHDFLLTRVFHGIEGMAVHPREVALEVEGRRFWVSHGDLADRADYGYRALRAFFRSPVMWLLVTVFPGEWLDRIGRESSGYSRGKRPVLFGELPLERQEKLRKIYRNLAAEKILEGYDFVVMGHCHDLDEMNFKVGGRTGQYLNVGFPRVHRSLLAWTAEDGKFLRKPL